jgi:hypothetical protein
VVGVLPSQTGIPGLQLSVTQLPLAASHLRLLAQVVVLTFEVPLPLQVNRSLPSQLKVEGGHITS